MGTLRTKTIHGVFWSTAERFAVQGIQFLVMILIAREVSPSDYGLVGMLAIFIAVSDSIVNSGFSQALIRKQDRTEADNCTVFFFNIVVGLFLYVVLFLLAPWIAVFFNEPQLCELMRVLCLIVIINSLAVVQRALLTAEVDFKTQTKASAIAAVVSGLCGISMAYMGYGVWTLVWQQLLNAGLNTLLLWFYSTWRPRLVYSWTSFRELFSFGSKLMISGLLDTIYNNLFQLVIGKLYTARSLGFYSRAYHFAEFPSSNITRIIQRVTFPVLCNIQDDNAKLADNYRKMLKLSAYIMFPMMVGLASLAYPFIDVVLGVKWHFAGTLLIPVSFSLMWYPVNAINLNLLQVKGRSDLFLKLEIIKKIMGTIVLVGSAPFGVIAMCYASIFSSLVSVVINTYYTGKLINVGFICQMRDLYPTLIVCAVMFCVIHLFLTQVDNMWVELVGGGIVGTLIYIGLTYFSRFSELQEIMLIIRKR